MEEIPQCFLNELFFGGNHNTDNTKRKKRGGAATMIESQVGSDSGVNAATSTSPRVYSCPSCSYTTIRKGDMRKHARIHSGVKPFICPICQRAFTQSSHLRVHTSRVHTTQ